MANSMSKSISKTHHPYNAAERDYLCGLSKCKEFSLPAAAWHDKLTEVYFRQGRIDEAIKHGQMALATKEKLAPDSMNLAVTLSNIGCIYFERKEYEKALYLLEGSQEIRELLDPQSLATARIYTNLSVALEGLGRWKEALEKDLKALKIKEKMAPNTSTLATTYINLASKAIRLKNISAAEKLLDNAKRILGKTKTHHEVVAFLVSLGNLQALKGDTQGKIKWHRQACELEKKNIGESVCLATLYGYLAHALEEIGELEEARALKSKAIAIQYAKVPQVLETQCKKAPRK